MDNMVPQDISILYNKMNKIESRVTDLEATRPFLKDMIERNIQSHEKLSSTLQDVQMSMVRMNEKMDEQSEALIEMKKEFEESNARTNAKIEAVEQSASSGIKKVDARVTEVEEKGKFDIFLFIKDNLGWIMAMVAIGSMYLSKFMHF